MSAYRGVGNLDTDVGEALAFLHSVMNSRVCVCTSHSMIEIVGLGANDAVDRAVAIYLVSAVAACIDFTMGIRVALFDEATISRDLHDDVIRIIGPDNRLSDDARKTARDPWIWEGISHLLFHLSRWDNKKHPPAQIFAKSCPHLSVRDHGLDIIALYGTDTMIGVSAGECKAYLTRPADAIRDSANKLLEVDGSGRDAEIRQVIGQFRSSLPIEIGSRLTSMFWKSERAYFPMVCCDSTQSLQWNDHRDVLARLNLPCDRKYLVPIALDDAQRFFDRIADQMRAYTSGTPGGDFRV